MGEPHAKLAALKLKRLFETPFMKVWNNEDTGSWGLVPLKDSLTGVCVGDGDGIKSMVVSPRWTVSHPHENFSGQSAAAIGSSFSLSLSFPSNGQAETGFRST